MIILQEKETYYTIESLKKKIEKKKAYVFKIKRLFENLQNLEYSSPCLPHSTFVSCSFHSLAFFSPVRKCNNLLPPSGPPPTPPYLPFKPVFKCHSLLTQAKFTVITYPFIYTCALPLRTSAFRNSEGPGIEPPVPCHSSGPDTEVTAPRSLTWSHQGTPMLLPSVFPFIY